MFSLKHRKWLIDYFCIHFCFSKMLLDEGSSYSSEGSEVWHRTLKDVSCLTWKLFVISCFH